jgi:hypothetical protein
MQDLELDSRSASKKHLPCLNLRHERQHHDGHRRRNDNYTHAYSNSLNRTNGNYRN